MEHARCTAFAFIIIGAMHRDRHDAGLSGLGHRKPCQKTLIFIVTPASHSALQVDEHTHIAELRWMSPSSRSCPGLNTEYADQLERLEGHASVEVPRNHIASRAARMNAGSPKPHQARRPVAVCGSAHRCRSCKGLLQQGRKMRDRARRDTLWPPESQFCRREEK